jgi:hypothetical protein
MFIHVSVQNHANAKLFFQLFINFILLIIRTIVPKLDNLFLSILFTPREYAVRSSATTTIYSGG